MNRFLVPLVVAPLTGACVTGASDLDQDHQSLASDCPVLICGNTPLLGAHPAWELDERGERFSSNGLRIQNVTKGGIDYHFDVNGFGLRGIPVGGGPSVGMVGAWATIETDVGATTYLLSIQAGIPVTYVEGGNDGTSIPTYRITYVTLDEGRTLPPRALCGTDPLYGTARDALIYQGDRYDAVTGELSATGADVGGWFNIACKDDALWKLALFRHVEAASSGAHVTTAEQRLAGLRSIRADYCGNGRALTELGVPLDWTNKGGWLTVAPGHVVEAVWDEDGAVCLEEPRLLDRDEVPCSLPRCSRLAGRPEEHGHIVTYVPAPI